MLTNDLKPGQKFHFRGDWQTPPSDWLVTRLDEAVGMLECVPADGRIEKEPSFFHHNVTVEVIG